MTFDVVVEVQLREGIADPEGTTIERSLPTLGFDGVRGVRVGKCIRFTIEATDEASHEGDAQAKTAALERIDREIVGPVHANLRSRGDYRILVSPDHPTFLRTKTHSHGYVPFAMCGTGISPSGAQAYDEAHAAASPLVFDRGCDLMPWFLANAK